MLFYVPVNRRGFVPAGAPIPKLEKCVKRRFEELEYNVPYLYE
jgi:hypothetical protein